MLYLITALSPEAKPVIDYFNLKRMETDCRFELYQSDKALLARSGTGKILSAAATAYVCAIRKPAPNDVIAQIGICGTPDESIPFGQLCLVNKISDQSSGKDFYPDIIIDPGFPEKAIRTHDKPVKINETNIENTLVDMEASGFFQSAQVFFQPHQIACFKVVSDHLSIGDVNKEKITVLIDKALPLIVGYLDRLADVVSDNTSILTEQDTQMISSLCERFHFTTTQYHRLQSATKIFKIKTESGISFLNDFLSETTSVKSESKKVFETIIRKLEE